MKDMKQLLFALIIITSYSCGTMMGAKIDESFRSMEIVYDFPGKTKNELYIAANTWFVENFTSAENVIEFQDKESGKIAGKYTFSYLEGVYYQRVKQTVNIDIKEEKLRIVFSNPMYNTYATALGDTYYDNTYKPLITQKGVLRARQEWSTTAKSLEAYLKSKQDW